MRLDRNTRLVVIDFVEDLLREMGYTSPTNGGGVPIDFDPGDLAGQLLTGLNTNGNTSGVAPGPGPVSDTDPGDLTAIFLTGLTF